MDIHKEFLFRFQLGCRCSSEVLRLSGAPLWFGYSLLRLQVASTIGEALERSWPEMYCLHR